MFILEEDFCYYSIGTSQIDTFGQRLIGTNLHFNPYIAYQCSPENGKIFYFDEVTNTIPIFSTFCFRASLEVNYGFNPEDRTRPGGSIKAQYLYYLRKSI